MTTVLRSMVPDSKKPSDTVPVSLEEKKEPTRVDTKKPTNKQLFRSAIFSEDINQLIKIIDEGFPIDTPLGKYGETGLHLAITRQSKLVTFYLMSNEANPYTLTTLGQTAYRMACLAPDKSFRELFLTCVEKYSQNFILDESPVAALERSRSF